MKNAKGTGSVYRMKDCKRRKTWRAISSGVRNKITGKVERVNIGIFETRNEALEALFKYNANPYDVKSKKLTFFDVVELWKLEHLSKVSDGRKSGILSRLRMMYPL
jgi:hypothetical protein